MPDMTLEDYAKLFEGLLCRWDHAPLTGKVDHYNHEGGEPIAGFEMPQWISMKCSECDYAWSLNKLPILRHHTERFRAAQAQIEGKETP